MAGNTKLIGFLPNNRIQLERWGTTVGVALSVDSIDALRLALQRDLPQKPHQGRAGHLDEFASRYDEGVGRASLSLSIDTAAYLADLLDVMVKGNVQAMDKVRPWIEGLHAIVQAHADFHNTNEPGVASEEHPS